jgi:hypothetical protein
LTENPEQPDLSLLLERVDGVHPVTAADPRVIPYMKLEHVECLQPRGAQALLQAVPDV